MNAIDLTGELAIALAHPAVRAGIGFAIGGADDGFPFRFTGQKLDPGTGFYYYNARYYDPKTGR